jgi:hypothetical protein
MSDHGDSRWARRNGAKATVRNRVWDSLVESGVSVGPAFDRIPNFATELELIATNTSFPQPQGVAWDKVRADQFADIPFLNALRRSIKSRKRGS